MNLTRMSDEDRRWVCFHEAGHMAMAYWLRKSLHGWRIVIHKDGFGGSNVSPHGVYYCNEGDLMVLLGGPMAELLYHGIEPKRAIRFRAEYYLENSDTTHIRNVVRILFGRDNKRYQFEVQERVRLVMQEPLMWRGVSVVAERLFTNWGISGEEFEKTFEDLGVTDWCGKRHARPVPNTAKSRQGESRRPRGRGLQRPAA